ncbi:MAG: translocation/assembly module TamB domain-containing protein, partial [Cryomorphaceae bacterium]
TFNGSLVADETYICRGDSMAFLNLLQVTALGDIDNRKISLTSDVADVNITGAFNIDALPKSFLSLISEVMPSLVQQPYIGEREEFDFNINYKAGGVISRTLFPGFTLAPNSTAFGSYNSTNRSFGLYIKSDFIKYGDFAFENINMDAGKISEVVKARIYASQMAFKDFEIENLDADIEAYADIAEVGLGWFNRDESSQGELEGRVILIDRKSMEIQLKPGFIGRDQTMWNFENESVINIDSSKVCVEELAITHRDQELRIFGCISEDVNDQLNLEMSRFSIAAVDTLIGGALSDIGGIIDLKANIRDFYNDRSIKADGSLTGLSYKGYEIGDISATSNYVGEGKKLDIRGDLKVSDQELIAFNGDYNIGEDEPLDGSLVLSDFDLDVLNAFDIPEVNDYSGKANGEISVKGGFDKPLINGFIDFDRARFKVEYLNTYFEFSDEVRVEEDWFGIDYKPIYDSRGQKGSVVASAFHENFKNWTYDIFATVNDFYLMNTTRQNNDTYFGTAYASGELQLGGYQGFLEINIDAETEAGTVIKLPLDETEEVTLENFVYFVDSERKDTTDREADLSGVQLRLNIDATTDAEAQIIFDEQTGDILRGRGSGKLTFEISPSGEFLMFGRYEIEEGDYLFTLKNLINKRFTLRKGGIIGWYGDPYNADIDLSASYLVRAPLFPIMVENQEVYRSREDINVVLRLREKLMNPTINFDIELPQATETERSQLASVVSTTQQLNQQVFALLILNRFLPIAAADQQNQAASGVGGLGSATTSDFVSTQISNWLSEISNDFDIGVNYRPGDQISNQEIAVALSTQLFNERLTVRGNFGVTSASETQYTQGRSGILGDFLLEYALTEEGKIRLKVFNETNPYEVFSTSSSIYTQGVGLIYQEDFDTMDEFFREVKTLFQNDEAQEAP